MVKKQQRDYSYQKENWTKPRKVTKTEFDQLRKERVNYLKKRGLPTRLHHIDEVDNPFW